MGRPYTSKAGAAQVKEVTVSSNTELVAFNASRVGLAIHNTSGSALSVFFGAETTNPSYSIAAGEWWEVPDVAANLRVSASGSGDVVVTEFI